MRSIFFTTFVLRDITIRPFEPGDQNAARRLILAGLGEHFAEIDPTLNSDLDDIWLNYIASGHHFLVVFRDGVLVGSGALVKESATAGRIVRMSIAGSQRRQGIGRLLVRELLDFGAEAGYERIVVETNDDWHSAIQLYQKCGFTPYDHRDGEIHMILQLTANG